MGSGTAYSYETSDQRKARPTVEFDLHLHEGTPSKKLLETGKRMHMVASYCGDHGGYAINGKPIKLTINIGYYAARSGDFECGQAFQMASTRFQVASITKHPQASTTSPAICGERG